MLLFILLLGSAAAAIAPPTTSFEPLVLHFQVDPQKELCLHEDVPAGHEIDASVLVYRGGKLDIKMRIESPDGVVPYEQLIFSNLDDKSGAMLDTIVKKGTKLIAPRAGTYVFCLDNRMARWTAKVMTFELRVRDPAVKEEGRGGAAVAALAAGASASETAAHSVALLKALAAKLHARLMAIENAQIYHFHREVQHRSVLELTSSRVHWWGAAEGLVVLLLTAAQVVLIRTWVTKKQAQGGQGLPRAFAGV